MQCIGGVDERICVKDLNLFSKVSIPHHNVILHRYVNILAAAWTKAAEIAIKFLDTEKVSGVAGVVGPRLVEIGRLNSDKYVVSTVDIQFHPIPSTYSTIW